MSLILWLPLNRQTYSTIPNQGLMSTSITRYGSTIVYTAGKIGQAPNFSNSAFVINPAPITTNMNKFSFAFWFRSAQPNATQCFYNGRSAAGNAIAVFLIGGNFRVDDGWQHTFSNYTYSEDTWIHVCITRDTDNIKLYINGNLVETQTSTAFTCDVTYASIGMSSQNTATPSGNPLLGQLNDYRIYDHTLSAKEVKEIAKGMILHLPLSWGGNPNMIKDSYTWMNKRTGNDNSTGNLASWSKGVSESNTAPCKWVFRCTGVNSNSSATGNYIGAYFGLGSQGLTVNDLVENETYTYSFWARITPDSTGTTTFREEAICEGQTILSSTGFGNLTTEWRKHTATFKWTKTTKLTICFYTSFPANSTVTYELCGLKLEKSSKATPYIPNVNEPEYTSLGYANKYLQDCSGYNYPVSGYGANNTSCESPKGSSGTNCGSGSCIVLGKTCKVQYPMSFAFWFNTSNLQNNSNRLISCTEGGGWNVELNGNYLCWTTGTGTSSNTYKFCISTKTYTELQGAWHHVACTYDGLKSQIYIDGELSKETVHFTTATPLYYNANNGVFMTAEAGGSATTPATTYTTDTKICDFRMYATVISADDIKELYQVSASIDKSGNIYCCEVVE